MDSDPLLLPESPEKRRKKSVCPVTCLKRTDTTFAGPKKIGLQLSALTQEQASALSGCDTVLLQGSLRQSEPTCADEVSSNFRPMKVEGMPDCEGCSFSGIVWDGDESQRRMGEIISNELCGLLAVHKDVRIISQPREARFLKYHKANPAAPLTFKVTEANLAAVGISLAQANHLGETIKSFITQSQPYAMLLEGKTINSYGKSDMADLDAVVAMLCIDDEDAWDTKYVNVKKTELPYCTKPHERPLLGVDVKTMYDQFVADKKCLAERLQEATLDQIDQVLEDIAELSPRKTVLKGYTDRCKTAVPSVVEVSVLEGDAPPIGAIALKTLRPDAVCRVFLQLLDVYNRLPSVGIKDRYTIACIDNCWSGHKGCPRTIRHNDVDDPFAVEALLTAGAGVNCIPAYTYSALFTIPPLLSPTPRADFYLAFWADMAKNHVSREQSQTELLQRLHEATEGEAKGEDLAKVFFGLELHNLFTSPKIIGAANILAPNLVWRPGGRGNGIDPGYHGTRNIAHRYPFSSLNLMDQSMGWTPQLAGRAKLQLAKKNYPLENGQVVQFDMKLPLGQPAVDFKDWNPLGHMMITMSRGPPMLNQALPSTAEELEISELQLKFTKEMVQKYQGNAKLTEMWETEDELKQAVAGLDKYNEEDGTRMTDKYTEMGVDFATWEAHDLVTQYLLHMEDDDITGPPGMKIRPKISREDCENIMDMVPVGREASIKELLDSLCDQDQVVLHQPPSICSQMVDHWHSFLVPESAKGVFFYGGAEGEATGPYVDVEAVLEAKRALLR